jgi:hypothetical protein
MLGCMAIQMMSITTQTLTRKLIIILSIKVKKIKIFVYRLLHEQINGIEHDEVGFILRLQSKKSYL